MKSIQLNMDCAKQIRKGTAVVTQAVLDGDHQKSRYAMHLIDLMIKGIAAGQPQPWSQFAPMIDEEFDN